MINLPFHVKLAQKTYDLMCRQERAGVCFDTEAAKKLVIHIDAEMERIRSEIEPKLPTRPLKKGELNAWTPPKKTFNIDGSISVITKKWFDDIEEIYENFGCPTFYGYKNGIKITLPHHEPIITKLPMELKDQNSIKEWLVSLGWRPTFFNFKRDANGKPARDERGKVITTTPKLQDMGRLCPNLKKLGDKVKLVQPICTWLSLRNRRSVLCNEAKNTGWLNHPRLKIDGRLPAASSGLTNTHRQKHKVLVNVPRPGSLLGKEFRSLFLADKDWVMVGADASGLEDGCKAHYTYKYDNGEYAAKVLDPEFDVHQENANIWHCERQEAKSPAYALQYGCSVGKFAETLGVPLQKGKELYEDYWVHNWALKSAIEEVEKEFDRNNRKYITLDIPKLEGHKVVTRSRHSVFNARCQSLGAKVMDLAGVFLDKWIKQRNIPAVRLIYSHDEYQYTCPEKYSELLGELMVKSIIKSGEFLELNVKLAGEYKVSTNWAGTH